MKKYIVTIMALLCFQAMNAQTDGCLIVKEFSPDNWQTLPLNGTTTYFDMDDDGEYDFRYYAEVSHTLMSTPNVLPRNGGCFHTTTGETYAQYGINNFFSDFDTPLNDTTLVWDARIYPEKGWIGHYHLDTIVFKSGIRNGEEGEYYYGWMEAYSVVTYNYDTVWFYLARTCFCTIPNYPLRWGQTSLSQGLEENGSVASAMVYPNPANATITVIGESLRRIEITNMLGQRVATHEAEGSQATIDISSLPTGIYFVGITDENGKRCVKKVVKE